MPWFKVDDKLHSHPKARRAGLEAMGLWSLAGSHAMDYLTDGVVERWFVEAWPRGVKLAAQLVNVGLWREHPDGWVFHDWDQFQPTRESVLAERDAAAERMRRVRANKPRTFADGSPSPVPVPSPDSSKTSKSQSSSNRARGSTDSLSPTLQTLANQAGLRNIETIRDEIRARTGCDITLDRTVGVARHLLEKAPTGVRNAQAYVLTCVRETPAEIQQHIHNT